MKTSLLVFIICIVNFSFSQKLVPLDSVQDYIGKEVKVCVKVEGTHKSNGKSQLIFLNLGKPYPDAPLLAVIFEKDFKNFNYAPEKYLDKKNVCITGKLVLYKGKPEFVINRENQIQIE
ncbi:MAG: hypothetical protein CO119_08305 [Flavobacteriales bacterium CG_4_9_14_3_um_filter_40_17]|nr:MAG: hypothetical protein CO119_08305 [Flavobacteriales bacterium CG_4_9_14_3_um_filter_40_17]